MVLDAGGGKATPQATFAASVLIQSQKLAPAGALQVPSFSEQKPFSADVCPRLLSWLSICVSQVSRCVPAGVQVQIRCPSSWQGVVQAAVATASAARRARRMEAGRIARPSPGVKRRPPRLNPGRPGPSAISKLMLAAALALLLAAPAGSAPAAPEADAAALARRVQRYYEATRDLEARFTQTYTYEGFGRKQVSKGTVKLKKPGMMRWDYLAPTPKTIAVKGSRLVQFEPEENQAFVDERFDASAMSAAVTFLMGKGDLAREFDASLGEGGVLVLTPKEPDPRVERIELSVGPEGQVRASRVIDGSRNVNELTFEDVRRNVGIADAAFEVKLPKDVRLVGPPGR